ncbi:hypothetical protein BDN70DRAFT_836867 [Pholiota conissans]|uniref:Uncharacterized protein n=1 Tax=Pholiota conissans TaxID=109636 RepID=A0A9P5Z0H1_9AGAR|nr:hypothetical protein BDN70DRAFT_836867 [Pholiota conissans]
MSAQPNPPFYVLVAQSTVSNIPAGALSNNLSHPVINYHYADDSPLSILPTHPDGHVLVMNYDRDSIQPTVQSISADLSVTGLKLAEAPGAALADPAGTTNNVMFIIETTSDDRSMTGSNGERKAAQAVLAQFKHRNNVLRRALQYPNINTGITSLGSEPYR